MFYCTVKFIGLSIRYLFDVFVILNNVLIFCSALQMAHRTTEYGDWDNNKFSGEATTSNFHRSFPYNYSSGCKASGSFKILVVSNMQNYIENRSKEQHWDSDVLYEKLFNLLQPESIGCIVFIDKSGKVMSIKNSTHDLNESRSCTWQDLLSTGLKDHHNYTVCIAESYDYGSVDTTNKCIESIWKLSEGFCNIWERNSSMSLYTDHTKWILIVPNLLTVSSLLLKRSDIYADRMLTTEEIVHILYEKYLPSWISDYKDDIKMIKTSFLRKIPYIMLIMLKYGFVVEDVFKIMENIITNNFGSSDNDSMELDEEQFFIWFCKTYHMDDNESLSKIKDSIYYLLFISDQQIYQAQSNAKGLYFYGSVNILYNHKLQDLEGNRGGTGILNLFQCTSNYSKCLEDIYIYEQETTFILKHRCNYDFRVRRALTNAFKALISMNNNLNPFKGKTFLLDFLQTHGTSRDTYSNVQGSSIGAAIFLLLYARLTDQVIPMDLFITGEVATNGNILKVQPNSILDKYIACINSGGTKFIMPIGNKMRWEREISKGLKNLAEITFVSSCEQLVQLVKFQ